MMNHQQSEGSVESFEQDDLTGVLSEFEQEVQETDPRREMERLVEHETRNVNRWRVLVFLTVRELAPKSFLLLTS